MNEKNINIEQLVQAGTALYMAGRWSCDADVDEAKLWEDLRDALGLPQGTETARAQSQRDKS